MSDEKPATYSRATHFKLDDFIRRAKNSRLWLYLNTFREIIVLGAFYIPYVASLLTGPQLTIHYELIDLPVPHNVVEAAKLIKTQQDPEANQEIAKLARFVSSPHLLQIWIRNNTAKSVGQFELTIENVDELHDVGVSSDSQKVLREARNIATTVPSELHVLSFPALTDIPPFATIRLSIWGAIYPPIFRAPIKVRASTEKAVIYKIGKATDFALFISDNQAILVGILLVFFFWLGIRRWMSRR